MTQPIDPTTPARDPTALAHDPAPVPPELRRAEHIAGLVGAGGLAGCIIIWVLVGFFFHGVAGQFYRGWLFAWMLWLGASLGGMAAVMLHHLTGGKWGLFVRRFGEAAAMTLPLLFLLGVPFLVGMRHLYPWADPSVHDAVVEHKRVVFFPGFFVARYCAYFIIWMAMAFLLRIFSLRHDRHPSEQTAHYMRVVSAGGLVIYVVSMSLAAVDWIMSMEPRWFSTMFGFIICEGQAISGCCLIIIMLALMMNVTPFKERIRPNIFNDLGNLLLTCVVLWAYCAFAQLLVTWMGNLQSEIGWYVQRTSYAWRIMAALLIFLGFLTPFVLLLMRGIKKRAQYMIVLCSGLAVMRALDVYWMVAPGGSNPFPVLHWVNGLSGIVALVGIGGMWVAAFLWLLAGHPLIPLGETVPVEVLPSDELSPAHRVTEHAQSMGTQPGLA